MKENIIGRKEEQQLLHDIYHSSKSEFVAVCGRRRVGKTFLVREYFENEIVFHSSGLANSGIAEQLSVFSRELQLLAGEPLPTAASWMDAFFTLRSCLEKIDVPRKVILLDELPWMDTPRSGFVAALEYFWNVWASARHDIVLIVCGSATSWMTDKLINSHGGLHNRLTNIIYLQPFTLGECRAFFQSRGFHLSDYEIAEYYMILGGTPFYLDLLRNSMSLSQNIDNLLFRSAGTLHNEFGNLYAALFKNSSDYITVVKALTACRSGMTRNEIVEATGMHSGGALTTILNNLTACGFVREYRNFLGRRGSDRLYQLVDFFTLFYFRFMNRKGDSCQWMSIQGKPEFHAWAGLTFELLVLHHIKQLKRALGISGVQTEEFAWRGGDANGQSQVDLVISRADQTLNVCEMKFCVGEYEITKTYNGNLREKVARIMQATGMKKSVLLTMITTHGVKPGTYSGIVQQQVTLDDLFAY